VDRGGYRAHIVESHIARIADIRSILMSAIAITDDLFFNRGGLDRARAERTVADALKGGDDGELFLEFNQSEALSFDDGRLKSASFDVTQGFGLRAVASEAHAYAHASDLSDEALQRAAATVKAVHAGYGGTLAEPPQGTNRHHYSDDNPLAKMEFGAKVALLQEIDAYARAKDSRVRQVMASISGNWQAVQIIRGDGTRAADLRPLVRLNVSVMVDENGRMETGGHGTGGRFD
jgi:TldD protein